MSDLLAEARAQLVRLTPERAHAAALAGAVLVDVRAESQRGRDGEIPGAVVVDRTVLEWRLDPNSPHRIPECPGHDDLVVVICDQGYSSSLAATVLRELGFHRATDVIGGLQAWRDAGLPLVTGAPPTDGVTPPSHASRLPDG